MRSMSPSARGARSGPLSGGSRQHTLPRMPRKRCSAVLNSESPVVSHCVLSPRQTILLGSAQGNKCQPGGFCAAQRGVRREILPLGAADFRPALLGRRPKPRCRISPVPQRGLLSMNRT
jgi:hypothetical protein